MGASGGTQIPTSEALVALRTLMFEDVSLEAAVREPRIHHQLQPNELLFENIPKATVDAERLQSLRDFGHNATAIPDRGSVVMAIARTSDGDLETVTDWRKGGAVDGF
jgi:gamma-glutamyltranspeptidase